ncbi:MAG TPA: lytic polysaccharide monooxygenase [Steroidobacteraceae bacterium]|nr:lytic polysaccharide monooxygenase [Steroidobacteraceae bacterium]
MERAIMKNVLSGVAVLCALALLVSAVFAHGLIQDPPSRNWFCGFITKPDHVQNGVAEYPVCGDAFFAPDTNPTDGYSFMSVLTHTTGREGVGPRDHVCSFDSESFPGRTVPWDVPIDWPTTPISAGPRNFVWSISWGPHFSDTADFKYWITRPDFVWQTGRELSFSDFEEAPFCSLAYNDATPNANPNVIPDVANARFTTRCTVPSRTGRHVIYGEWGRTPPTFERFHGCVDVTFSGNPPPVITANVALDPDVTTFTGPGSITLDGRGSTGSNLSYTWSVAAPNAALYSITNSTSPVATLNLNAPSAAQDVTVTLLITSGNSSDTESRSFLHQPAIATPWQDLGALTADPRTLVVGDRVSVRTVSSTGQDAFWPTTPITITAANTGATQWPVTLGNAINALNGTVRVGVLDTSNNTITPAANATSNRVYAMTSANLQSAFLQLVPGAVPDAPTGLAATAGDAQASLSWSAVSGASGYNVKRSTTSGGPYANVATGVTATSFTNTGLSNGTQYFYVVTAVNASGESAISNQASATPSVGGGSSGGATASGVVASASPWFNELQVQLTNTQTITSLTVTVNVARTTGVSQTGQYNTVGGQILQAASSTASQITYTWTLGSGQQLGPQTQRTFAAQFGGTGTPHPVSGDSWSVSYTVSGSGAQQTLQGTF